VVVELDSEAVRTLVELALAVMLFANATEVSARWLRGSGQLPLRMLALGFPLTVATGFASGYLLLPGMSIWVLALLAAALAATGAALASSWPAPWQAAERPGARHRWATRWSSSPAAGR
jgi:sodium/hydrogen antiporter